MSLHLKTIAYISRENHHKRISFLSIVILLCTVFYAGKADADFLTSVTLDQTPQAGGFIEYSYTLTNAPTSDLPATLFALTLSPNADLQAITEPTGWSNGYNQGDSTIVWELDNFNYAAIAGSSSLFSFTSPLQPGISDSEIVGTDQLNSQIEFNDNMILAPNNTAVIPEPASGLLVFTGILVLLEVASRQRAKVMRLRLPLNR